MTAAVEAWTWHFYQHLKITFFSSTTEKHRESAVFHNVSIRKVIL